MIRTVVVGLHQVVRHGDALVYLDDTPERIELGEIQSRVIQLTAQVQAERARIGLELDRLTTNRDSLGRSLQAERAQAEIDVVRHETLLAVEQISYQGAVLQLDVIEQLVDEGFSPTVERVARQTRVNELHASLEHNSRVLQELHERLADVDRRWGVFIQAEPDAFDFDPVLTPITLAAQTERERLASVAYRIERLVLRAPADGQVVSLGAGAGVNVQGGETILELAAAQSSRILVYLPESEPELLSPGDSVRIVRRSDPALLIEARVLSVASGITETPVRHRQREQIRQWGRAVLIEVPAGLAAVPGEAFFISTD